MKMMIGREYEFKKPLLDVSTTKVYLCGRGVRWAGRHVETLIWLPAGMREGPRSPPGSRLT